MGCCLGGASDGAGARLTAGCCLGRSSGGAVGGAGVQSLLSGVLCWCNFFQIRPSGLSKVGPAQAGVVV